MAKKCFYSFHYVPDNWRASKVRQIGAIEGSQTVSDNDWEAITRGGDAAIEKWIAGQMYGKSCTILLIGAATAGRIAKGNNPFATITLKEQRDFSRVDREGL